MTERLETHTSDVAASSIGFFAASSVRWPMFLLRMFSTTVLVMSCTSRPTSKARERQRCLSSCLVITKKTQINNHDVNSSQRQVHHDGNITQLHMHNDGNGIQ